MKKYVYLLALALILGLLFSPVSRGQKAVQTVTRLVPLDKVPDNLKALSIVRNDKGEEFAQTGRGLVKTVNGISTKLTGSFNTYFLFTHKGGLYANTGNELRKFDFNTNSFVWYSTNYEAGLAYLFIKDEIWYYDFKDIRNTSHEIVKSFTGYLGTVPGSIQDTVLFGAGQELWGISKKDGSLKKLGELQSGNRIAHIFWNESGSFSIIMVKRTEGDKETALLYIYDSQKGLYKVDFSAKWEYMFSYIGLTGDTVGLTDYNFVPILKRKVQVQSLQITSGALDFGEVTPNQTVKKDVVIKNPNQLDEGYTFSYKADNLQIQTIWTGMMVASEEKTISLTATVPDKLGKIDGWFYVSSENNQLRDSVKISMTVVKENLPPVVKTPPNDVAVTDNGYGASIVIEDPEKQTVALTVKEGPKWLVLSRDNNTFFLEGKPDQTGVFSVKLEIRDGKSLVNYEYQLTVKPKVTLDFTLDRDLQKSGDKAEIVPFYNSLGCWVSENSKELGFIDATFRYSLNGKELYIGHNPNYTFAVPDELKGDSTNIKVDIIYGLPKKRDDIAGGIYSGTLSKKYFLPLSENFIPVITLPVFDKPFSPGSVVPLKKDDIRVIDKNDINIIKWIGESKDYLATDDGIIIDKDFTGKELTVNVYATDLKDTVTSVLKVDIITTGIESYTKKPSLSVYPNPLSGSNSFYVKSPENFDTAMLFNSTGQQITLEYFKTGNQFIIKELVQPGLYILKLKAGNKTYSVKIIKR